MILPHSHAPVKKSSLPETLAMQKASVGLYSGSARSALGEGPVSTDVPRPRHTDASEGLYSGSAHSALLCTMLTQWRGAACQARASF